MAESKLPASLSKSIRAYGKAHKEIRTLAAKLDAVEANRRGAVVRIFDEIEKDPSRYTQMIRKGKSVEKIPMTKALARQLRKELLQQQQPPKNPHGGPGCDDCDDIDECWCAFKAGPLCCYICLSPAVIQCHF